MCFNSLRSKSSFQTCLTQEKNNNVCFQNVANHSKKSFINQILKWITHAGKNQLTSLPGGVRRLLKALGQFFCSALVVYLYCICVSRQSSNVSMTNVCLGFFFVCGSGNLMPNTKQKGLPWISSLLWSFFPPCKFQFLNTQRESLLRIVNFAFQALTSRLPPTTALCMAC